ncbi:MAG: hypothetical protein V4671_16120, partial [Armatimonadota bacterium]
GNADPLSTIVRGYAQSVRPTGPISLGRVSLKEGANTVELELVGKDPRSAGYMAGLDGFILKR